MLVSVFIRTIFLVLLFSQYARNVHFPLPVYKAKKGWTSYRLQVFKMFPVSTHIKLLTVHTSAFLLLGLQVFFPFIGKNTAVFEWLHLCSHLSF